MVEKLDALLSKARFASPNERIEVRDAVAAHGLTAVEAMGEWLADPLLSRFAVRVIGKVADMGDRDRAVHALRLAREEATPDQQADIDAELRRLGATTQEKSHGRRKPPGPQPQDDGVPGWMMRTNRDIAEWIWSEAEAGRLRQGWGYQPKQELTLLRHRRGAGEPMDRDDDWAWPNRRMLADEPDGMQVGDLVFAPHLPREWHWSILKISGPYRYEIDPDRHDYGHIIPVDILKAGMPDDALTAELRWVRTYPARLRRLTRQAYEDLLDAIGPRA